MKLSEHPLIKELKIDEVFLIEHPRAIDSDRIKLIEENLSSYDEGRVVTEYVFQDIKENKFYSFTYMSDSWSEYWEELNEIDVVEVKLVEKTILVYEPV